MDRAARITRQEAEDTIALGLGAWWDEEHTLMLIRPEDLAVTPPGTVLKSIFGTLVTVGVDEIDSDTRGGMIAFGYVVGDG